jgi:hypothetical protein
MSEERPLYVQVAEAFDGTIRRGLFVGNRSDRFWSLIEKTPTCWIWHGTLRTYGYGAFKINGRSIAAHRITYMLRNGHIPEDLELDHLCRVPACVNPAHLEAVTHRTNVLRGTSPSAMQAQQPTCSRGHEFTKITSRGRRHCVICHNLGQRRRYAQRKGLPAIGPGRGLCTKLG